MGFINADFASLCHPAVGQERVVDTMALARRKHPKGPNSLDALCRRYGIDNTRRTKHGALLDAELLAEVYIELIGGKQAALGLDSMAPMADRRQVGQVAALIRARPAPLPPRLTETERAAHAGMVETLGEKALWLKVSAE
jgi:DNA polymerase-3 subunit epsilon